MELKIGILLPRSDMFPRLSIDFLNGIKLPFSQSTLDNCVPKFIIESVGNASDESLLQKVEQMLLQDETDVIVSFCSFFMLDGLVKLANSYRKPIVHVTLGARVLKPSHNSPYVIHQSLNVCQTSYLSGRYAAMNFGKKAALLCSFYDGAYQISESFFQGFTQHGGEIIYNYVSPMDYKSETYDVMIEGLKNTNPEVMFSIFSFKEGNKVLTKMAQSGLDSVPTVAVPLMTDETNEKENELPENFYSIASWAFGEDAGPMDDFKVNYQNKFSETPNIFGLLGDEIGTLLVYCLENENSIPAQIGAYFSDKTIETPRGELRFSQYNESIPQFFKVRRLEPVEGNYQNAVVEVLDSSFSEIIYKNMEELPYTGWKNPYICT